MVVPKLSNCPTFAQNFTDFETLFFYYSIHYQQFDRAKSR